MCVLVGEQAQIRCLHVRLAGYCLGQSLLWRRYGKKTARKNPRWTNDYNTSLHVCQSALGYPTRNLLHIDSCAGETTIEKIAPEADKQWRASTSSPQLSFFRAYCRSEAPAMPASRPIRD